MDFQFDICNTEASQLKVGDYILYDGWTVRIIDNKIHKTGKHGHMKCTIEGRSLRSGRKVLIMLAGHMVVEKTNVINKSYSVMFTRVEEKKNTDGSTDVHFDAFDEDNEPLTFTLELTEKELNYINTIRHEKDEYELRILAFPTKMHDEYNTFVKFVSIL